MKNRSFYFGLHLIASLFSFVFLSYFIFFLWYPFPFSISHNIFYVYFILFTSIVVVFPSLTFFLYKTEKKKFFFDLVVVVFCQIFALLYFIYILEKGRVSWIVFIKDDIEVVSPIDFLDKQIELPSNKKWKINFWNKPIWVAAVYSNDENIKIQQEQDEIVKGISFSLQKDSYKNISYKSRDIVKSLKKIDQLYNFNERVEVEKYVGKYPNTLGYLPVKAPRLDMVALFDTNGYPIKIVNLRPWE